MQPNRGLPLGRPLGSALSIHLSWVPAGALVVAHLSFVAYGDRGLLSALVLGAQTVLAYLVCMVIHAFAHVVAGRITGARPVAVAIFLFGDVATMPPISGRERVLTAVAGPIASGVLAGVSLTASAITDGPSSDLLRTVGFANAAVAVLNLLPALPLDGGHVIASGGRRWRRLAVRMGRLVGLGAAVAGIWALLGGPERIPETAFGLWLVLVGLFVVIQSNVTTASVSPLIALRDETVGAWAVPFIGRVDAASTAPSADGPYAVSEEGRLTGVLTQAPAVKGAKAADVMIPWSAELNMPTEASLIGALEKLSNERVSVVIAVDREGVVRGVLDERTVRMRLGEV